MAMQLSNLQKILQDLGITPVYEYNGRTFYDTKDVFDRHNFARDVKRNVDEDEWVLEKTKYYLSERGVVMFAFKKGVSKVMERFMRVLESPAFPEVAMGRPDPPTTSGSTQSDPSATERKDVPIYGNDPSFVQNSYQYPNTNPYLMQMVPGMSYPNQYAQMPQPHGMTKEQQDHYAAQMAAQQEAYAAAQQHMIHQQQQYQQQYAAQFQQHQRQQQQQQQQQQQRHNESQQQYTQPYQQQTMPAQAQFQQNSNSGDYGVPSNDNLKAAAFEGVRQPYSQNWSRGMSHSRDPSTSPENSSYEVDPRLRGALV